MAAQAIGLVRSLAVMNEIKGRSRSAIQSTISWSCPDEGTVALNSDGSVAGPLGTAGCGGILKNTQIS